MPREVEESDVFAVFREWFFQNGGRIHDNLYFLRESSGLAVHTRSTLNSGVVAAACPFSLAITVEATQRALIEYCHLSSEEQLKLSQRQLICTYIGLHYIIGEVDDEKCLLQHRPYVSILPKAENMLTPLYFTDNELDMFKGTNLYGASLDQRKTYTDEHQMLQAVMSEHSSSISDRFTFDMYKIAATFLSSRAFPSTLLSQTPSLVATPSSYPVLLPGVDMFNHKRGQRVSWTISRAETTVSTSPSNYATIETNSRQSDLSVALVIDSPIMEGEELFNNYGPKPNSSFILAYGFALPDNPDDTILLKVGSNANETCSKEGVRYEVGRKAAGAGAVWDDVRRIIAAQHDIQSGGSEEADSVQELQIDMETVGTLSDMVSSLVSRLPDLNAEYVAPVVRKEVYTMWRYYVQGQKDILEAFLEWLERKDREAVRRAEELGINVVGDGSEDE